MASSTSAIPLRETHTPQDTISISLEEEEEAPAPNPSAISNISVSPELRPMTRQRQILVLISSFLTICITIGFNQAYGVFQSYYISPSQTMLPKTTAEDGALVAFVGSLGYGLTWGGSIFVNPVIARLGIKGTRGVSVLGVLCMSAGFGLASLSTRVSILYFLCPVT